VNFSSNFSAPFIRRPVATTLLTIAIFLSGAVAFKFLPAPRSRELIFRPSPSAQAFPAQARKRWLPTLPLRSSAISAIFPASRK